MNYHSIAIDGPSGAGKSTLDRMLAQELGYLYVDTGAIYRTVGLCAFRKGVEPTDARAVTALLDGMEIDLRYEQDGVQHMYLDGEDVTREIRRHEISRYASDVSAIPAVRAFLLERQRELARRGDVIMDGRDIGTNILPNADVKIYLTASVETRAKRRYDELASKGESCDFDEIARDIKERDERDMTREIAPLKKAEDAILVDSSDMTIDEVVSKICSFCN